GGCITFRMSDVQTGAARIWKHIEHVEFRLGRVEIFLARIRRVKNMALIPDGLPLGLNLVERIWFAALAAHCISLRKAGKPEKKMDLLLATRNPNKTREFHDLLGQAFDVIDLSSFPAIAIPEETGRTFEENAALKA